MPPESKQQETPPSPRTTGEGAHMRHNVCLFTSLIVSLFFIFLPWSAGYARSPFGGTPWPAPGFIEVENFDEGAEQETYHDTTPANEGNGEYRPSTGVDFGKASDVTYVGWVIAKSPPGDGRYSPLPS